jgi:hypothetical protein
MTNLPRIILSIRAHHSIQRVNMHELGLGIFAQLKMFITSSIIYQKFYNGETIIKK